MNPTNPSNLATYNKNKPEELEYPTQESRGCQKSTRYGSVNALTSGNNSNCPGLFTQRATDSSLEKKTRNPVNDFSSRHFPSSACSVYSHPSMKVSETSQHQPKQSVDDESTTLSNPVALNSSDNPTDHDVTSFNTGAVSETGEKIFSDYGPAQSFGDNPRFRDAHLDQFEIGCRAFFMQLRQLLEDKKRLLQSTTTGSSQDGPAQNAVSLLDGADASLNALHYGYFKLLKEVENCCALIDRIPERRTEERGVHFQRPEQARQEKEEPSSTRVCEHYHRRCLVLFPCCNDYYPCHRCHNMENECGNTSVKASQAISIKCDNCHVEQKIKEDSQYCSACKIRFSDYFCAKCKHFTSMDLDPYHCDKCGLCRVSKNKSFHCDVCNICLDRRLEGNHECRPQAGNDLCCFCLEDTFSGCQILPCSHKIHKACAITSIENGYIDCSFCLGS